MSTGYENREESKEDLIPPEEAKWQIEIENLFSATGVYVNVRLNNEVAGFLHLPSLEYVKWMRQKLGS